MENCWIIITQSQLQETWKHNHRRLDFFTSVEMVRNTWPNRPFLEGSIFKTFVEFGKDIDTEEK